MKKNWFGSRKTTQLKEGLLDSRQVYPVLDAKPLLDASGWRAAHDKLRALLGQLGLAPSYFTLIYQASNERFAEFVQLLPEEDHGALASLLSQSLKRAELCLTEGGIELAAGTASPMRFAFALYTAALLLHVGKLFAFDCLLCDDKGAVKGLWHPWQGGLLSQATHGHYRLFPAAKKTDSFLVNSPLVPVMAHAVLPTALFNWLAEDRLLFKQWLATLVGDSDGGGDIAKQLHLIKHRCLSLQVQTDLSWPSTVAKATDLADDFFSDLAGVLQQANPVHLPQDEIFSWCDYVVLTPKVLQWFCQQKTDVSLHWKTVQRQLLTFPGVSLVAPASAAPEKPSAQQAKAAVEEGALPHKTSLFNEKTLALKQASLPSANAGAAMENTLFKTREKEGMAPHHGPFVAIPASWISFGSMPPCIQAAAAADWQQQEVSRLSLLAKQLVDPAQAGVEKIIAKIPH